MVPRDASWTSILQNLSTPRNKIFVYNQSMKPFLDRLILGFPVLFLKQYPYAWIAAVMVWPLSRPAATLFLAIIAIGILSLRWQHAAWISDLRRRHAGEHGKFHLDEPSIPWNQTVLNLVKLLAISLIVAFILKGQLGLTFWQYFVMIVGFTLFYRDTQFFGPTATYIITATGIGIRLVPGHIDYRLFLPFKEISRIERSAYFKRQDTEIFARTREAADGLLLIPKDPNGFTKKIEKLFIAPGNVDTFMEHLPYGYGK
jgi:hypothetical protein